METKEKSYNLADFSAAMAKMKQISETAYRNTDSSRVYGRRRPYTSGQINKIIEEGSIKQKIVLSRDEYRKGGIYFRLINHYATVLKYAGLLVPHALRSDSLSASHIKKRYEDSLTYLEKLSLPAFFTDLSIKILRDGSYYGIITQERDTLSIIDIPLDYCRSNFKDTSGNNLIEFNVNYFTNIIDENERRRLLSIFPRSISMHYNRYTNGKENTPWILLPAEVGVYFGFPDGIVPFASSLKAIDTYQEATDAELERVKDEVRKILVQHIPHLNDGELLFEPDEAQEMHQGAVNMLAHNKSISVLTSYGNVDILTSKTSNEAARRTTMESMSQGVYLEAGASSQIFAATNSQALKFSMMNDIQFMMILGHQYGRFITNIINRIFGNQNVSFKYTILPVSIYTETDYIQNAFKLASSGYSFLVPAVALGIPQRDLMDLKELENSVLKLEEVLKPLQSAHTQSGDAQKEGIGPGRPQKALEERADKTIQNEEAKNEGGN